MINLLNDVSVLTDVSTNTLKKFVPVISYCLGHAILEGIHKKEEIVEVDIEIGQLDFKISSDGVRYRFTPSKEFEKLLIETVNNNSSPLLSKLDSNLQEKIDRAYKELL